MNEPDRERHKTIRGCAEWGEDASLTKLNERGNGAWFQPDKHAHPSFTCLCKSFRMCSRPRFASTDWNACLYV